MVMVCSLKLLNRCSARRLHASY